MRLCHPGHNRGWVGEQVAGATPSVSAWAFRLTFIRRPGHPVESACVILVVSPSLTVTRAERSRSALQMPSPVGPRQSLRCRTRSSPAEPTSLLLDTPPAPRDALVAGRPPPVGRRRPEIWKVFGGRRGAEPAGRRRTGGTVETVIPACVGGAGDRLTRRDMCHVHPERGAAERCGVLLGGAPERGPAR